MLPIGAASGAGHSGAAGSTGDTASISASGLPPHIIERLATEGIHDLQGWKKLGKRRFQIFGITTSVAKKITRRPGAHREPRERPADA